MFKVKKDQSRHWDNPSQLPLQLDMKKYHGSIHGSIFYSANSFHGNPHQVEDALQKNYHRYPALIPSMPWKDAVPPLAPQNLQVRREQHRVFLNWNPPLPAQDGEQASYYVVYRFLASERIDLKNPEKILYIGRDTTFTDMTTNRKESYTYAVTSVDRLHNESITLAATMLRRTDYTRTTEQQISQPRERVDTTHWTPGSKSLQRRTSRFKKSGQ